MRDGIDTETIVGWLNDLERSGMFRRFESAGKQWGVVTNWSRYQEVTTREVEIGSHRPCPPDWSEPEGWHEIVEKARKNGRIAKGSPWNGSGTVPEPIQNPTPTATPTATPTERENARAPLNEFEQERRWLESLGAITRRAGVCIITEWKAVTKRLKVAQVELIFRESVGIQWPSEFKKHREARGI
jgi:hypothetical protein